MSTLEHIGAGIAFFGVLLGLAGVLAFGGCIYAPKATSIVSIPVSRDYAGTNIVINQTISPSLNPSANLIGK